jgi:sugar/nucleoside kinase (ribokinase family)
MADPEVGRLLVLGELNADIVVEIEDLPMFGQSERIVPSIQLLLGSSSAITACGAATMSVPTSFVGVTGDDQIGAFVLEELRARGVAVGACRVDPDVPTGAAVLLTLPSGDRSILTAMGSIGQVRVDDVPEDLLAESAHVHVGSYFLQTELQGHLAEFFATCRARGLSTSLDPNDDPSGRWNAQIESMLGHVDVFFCNELEACRVSGQATLVAATEWFAERLPDGAEFVVKDGERGAAVSIVDRRRPGPRDVVAPAEQVRPLVDTIGAGDSLSAGYLAGRLRGLDPYRCLEIGVRNGTASTRASGGVAGQLTWQEVGRELG